MSTAGADLFFTTVRLNRDHAVLVDEDLPGISFDDESEPIEALQLPYKTITGRQLNRHRLVCLQGLKQETVLDVDCRLGHFLLPIPGA